MIQCELTVFSCFHGEEEQISMIPNARIRLAGGFTELYYEYEKDLVKLRFNDEEFEMKRTGRANFCLAVNKNGKGFLRLDEGGMCGETPLITDFYEVQGENCVEFAYHYENFGGEEPQRENIKLIIKKSEEK